MSHSPDSPARVAVIGAGPAGLMAAEELLALGCRVDLFDAMPSVGRKFLLAGVGGMNLTHSEDFESFLSRYAGRAAQLRPWLEALDGAALREWAHGLGVETFVGTSGRVFPKEMKAAPLLRAWLARLRGAGLAIHVRHRFLGWDDTGALRLAGPDGEIARRADATILALGGASWSRLGSDGRWVEPLSAAGVEIAPLVPANCGFDCAWSEYFSGKFAGHPLKTVAARGTAPDGTSVMRKGECVVTATGIEGSLVYAVSAPLRDRLLAGQRAELVLDLLPDRDAARLAAEIARPRGAASLANHLRKTTGLDGVKAALLRECAPPDRFADPQRLAAAIKSLPVPLVAPRPIDEAISSGGGVTFGALDDGLMLKALPGVFCAGEMIDWEAPTGGYLLTACFASGRVAARGVHRWLRYNEKV
ncbi:TIGR03862 family flavoprotein [Paludibacterium paludis]|uniref:NAD(FAD)-utilizing dehydrogenase n=1 Tax=Paludibacterium paludis TaxID=1225769 RepID=A0A918NYS7_9NEIS|nr:TIGR03862 family flavoprotein [Paludibacterium paludis]GGY06443.1 NAD(FAD)-utilizing dehydrogenase [Paludibacterium paludis]